MQRSLLLSLTVPGLALALAACEQVPSAVPVPGAPLVVTAPTVRPNLQGGPFTLADYGANLSFTYDGVDSVGFRLQRRPYGSDYWEAVPISIPAPGPIVDRSFPVEYARTFQYRLLACNEAGCSRSQGATVDIPQLAAPTNFTGVYTGNGIALAWRDNSTGEQSFLIQRRTPATTFRTVVTTAPNHTGYVDPAPVVGQKNIYRVYAWVRGDTKGRVSLAPPEITVIVPLPPPTVTAGSFTYPDYAVHVSFSYNGPAETNFRLERRLVNTPTWERVLKAVQTGTAFTDQTFRVSAQNDFEYRVSSCMDERCTGSAPVRVNTPRLRAPENVAAVLASGAVQVTWTDATTGEDAFMVERATSPTGPWSIPQAVPAGSTSFTDHTPVQARTNYYRVRPRVPGKPAPRLGTISATASVNVP